MATSNVFYLHALQLNSTVITQLTDLTGGFNFDDLAEFSAGQTAPQYSGSIFSTPDISFSTSQLASLLGDIDTAGVSVSIAAGNADLYYKKGTAYGTRVADITTQHVRGRMATNAMVYWNSVRASQGGIAELQARVLPAWDGSNAPLAYTSGVALAGTSQAAEQFTLGPIDLNGTTYKPIDVEFSTNVTPEEVADSGEPYPTYVGISQTSPSFTFRTRDTSIIASIGATGAALTSFEVYFRRLNQSGIAVADATTSHAKLHKASAAGTIKARSTAGESGIVEVFVQLIQPSAGTDPFDISTGVAIT